MSYKTQGHVCSWTIKMDWELVWECSREHRKDLLSTANLRFSLQWCCLRLLTFEQIFFYPQATWNVLFCIMPSQGRSLLNSIWAFRSYYCKILFNCLSGRSCCPLSPPWLFITWYSPTLIISSEKFSLAYLLVGWMKCPSNCFP